MEDLICRSPNNAGLAGQKQNNCIKGVNGIIGAIKHIMNSTNPVLSKNINFKLFAFLTSR